MRYATWIMTLALLAITSNPVMAQCDSLIREYKTWLDNPSPVPVNMRRGIGFTIVTNQRSDQPVNDLQLPSLNNLDASFKSVNVASYGIGNLIWRPDGNSFQLEGVGQFYFSDRSNDLPATRVYTGFTGRTDQIGLIVHPNGAVRITLRAWGNAVVALDTHCENGVMFGFGSGVGGNSRPAMYVLSFGKRFIPQ
jgi:hypothetical protein